MYDFEKDIFQKLFSKNYFTSLDSFEKIEYIIKNRKTRILDKYFYFGKKTLSFK